VSRAFEVLNELRACADHGIEWARPLDCGGSNGSDHSYHLSKLAKAGLAESRARNSWAHSRGSKEYRITEAGRRALETMK
jgi:hypothetical protein